MPNNCGSKNINIQLKVKDSNTLVSDVNESTSTVSVPLGVAFASANQAASTLVLNASQSSSNVSPDYLDHEWEFMVMVGANVDVISIPAGREYQAVMLNESLSGGQSVTIDQTYDRPRLTFNTTGIYLVCYSHSCYDSQGIKSNVSVGRDVVGANAVQISPKATLYGALDQNDISGLMRDDLRSQGIIPTTETYSSDIRFPNIGNPSQQTVKPDLFDVEGDEAIVDWVFVELRNSADNTSVIGSRAALIRRDSLIVDIDGVSPVLIVAPDGDYFISVRHRNHLGVLTANTFTLGRGFDSDVDFTDKITTYGTNAQAEFLNRKGLWPGDTDGNGQVILAGALSDVNPTSLAVLTDPANTTFSPTWRVFGYRNEDANLDGYIDINDQNQISLAVFNHPDNDPAFSPSFVINEQLP